jgi:hypothetical protein
VPAVAAAGSGALDAPEFDRKWPACGTALAGLAFELSDSGHDGSRHRLKASSGGFTFPTPSASEPDSWRYIEVVDKNGAPPTHPNQRFYDSATGRVVQKTLEHVALTWPTPTVQDAKNNGGPSQHARRTPPLNACADGPLNPVWVEWLMGFPADWTRRSAAAAAETPGRPDPDREAAAVAAHQTAPEATRSRRPRAPFAAHDVADGGVVGVRSSEVRPPAHPEARPGARPPARREIGGRRDIPRHRPPCARPETARSNPDLEADS